MKITTILFFVTCIICVTIVAGYAITDVVQALHELLQHVIPSNPASEVIHALW